jgi:GNAT superfamily N-acetyltransferase
MPTIRPATPQDAASAARLMTAFRQESGDNSIGVPTPDADDAAREQILLAEDGGAVVGILRLYIAAAVPDDAPRCDVTELYVTPTDRRQRIAMLLLAEAERIVRDQGVLELNIAGAGANEGAQRFCRAMGYTACETGFAKALPPKRSAKSRRAEG